MKKYSIKNMYSDALYWAISTQTQDEGYHITRTREAILRKLIHYSHSNEKITYSNENIAKHTFMGLDTIKKAIPELAKKGYISTATIKIFDNGKPKTRRIIYIKWDFIQTILDKVPKQEAAEEPTDAIDISIDEPIKEQTQFKPATNHNESTPTQTNLETYPIPDVVLTDEKFKWLKEKCDNPELSKELVENLSQDKLKELFYGRDGVWRINESSMENQFMIKFTHRGGSKCSLFDNSIQHDCIIVNIKDFGYYLKLKGILFDKFTLEQYRNIKNNGLVEKPIEYKEPCFIL